jgi:class 3 adenylate cyclase
MFLEEMTNAILEQRGMVDKYIGDAVMGVFDYPLNEIATIPVRGRTEPTKLWSPE